MESADNSQTSPPAELHAPHIRLACQACQRKKIKCDRTFPCGQCTRSSLTCVPSSRKQRMRHAGKRAVDGELRNRIAKLESLVESLSGEVNGPTDKASPDEFPPVAPTRTNSIELESPRVGKYVASQFWSSLTTEVAALRDVLDDDEEEEGTPDGTDGTVSTPGKPDGVASLEHDLIICPPGRIYVLPGAIEDPSHDVRKKLNAIFFTNVEPMYKIFHRPMLRAMIDDDAPYMGNLPGSHTHNALKRLVWLTALNSLTEAEVRTLTGESKIDALVRHRRFVVISLSQADLINTNDLATLQCALLLIAVCRTIDPSRRTWTLLALLVRIAQAMQLQHEDPRASPFMREMKRRVWHGLRFLDNFCALDRGTIPVIRSDQSSTPHPTNTNDDLFGPDSIEIPELKDVKTDMTHSIMCFHACDVVDELIAPETAYSGPVSFEQRHKVAVNLGLYIDKYLILYDTTKPLDRLQYFIGRSMKAAMILRAIRPMQRFTSVTPPAVNTPYVLRVAVDNLNASLEIFRDPTLEPWKWMRWVPWHPLAVALAGLCSIRGTDLSNEAWRLVGPIYAWCSLNIADSQEGMLWRPIAKLYKKALAFKNADPAANPPSTTDNLLQQLQQAPPSAELAALLSSNARQSTDRISQPPSDISSDLRSLDTSNGTYSTADVSFLSNDLSNPMTTQTSFVENLSNNFSTMDFNMPTTSPAQLANMDFSTMNATGTLPDADWTDWGQVMDEFADPLAMGNQYNDIDVMGNGWTWSNGGMQQLKPTGL